jgi:hypothetical protein
MVMLVRLEQSEKQELPNDVTDEGIVMLVSLEQPEKHLSANAVTVYSTPSSVNFSGTVMSPL